MNTLLKFNDNLPDEVDIEVIGGVNGVSPFNHCHRHGSHGFGIDPVFVRIIAQIACCETSEHDL